MKNSVKKMFDLSGRTVIITGGAGLLGLQHAEAVAEFGATPIIIDINDNSISKAIEHLNSTYDCHSVGYNCDITDKKELISVCFDIIKKYGKIDVLINNAAIDPKVKKEKNTRDLNRLVDFDIDQWNTELAVGLTGALLCVQVFGNEMVKRDSGVIINVSSDLGIIAPDQRLYEQMGVPQEQQPVKPVTYSVIKHGLIGLTKYIATYWANNGIRSNTLCPAGVYNNQPEDFVRRISELIPMGRMAHIDEYKAAIVFLASDASTYMNGHSVIIDGGRSVW